MIHLDQVVKEECEVCPGLSGDIPGDGAEDGESGAGETQRGRKHQTSWQVLVVGEESHVRLAHSCSLRKKKKKKKLKEEEEEQEEEEEEEEKEKEKEKKNKENQANQANKGNMGTR